MLMIKLRRVGKKKQPVFRLIVTERGRDPWGDNLEIVGWLNPRTKEKSLEVERIKYWLSKGAQTTDTIHNLFLDEKIIEGDKRRSITISKVRQGKLDAKAPTTPTPPQAGGETRQEPAAPVEVAPEATPEATPPTTPEEPKVEAAPEEQKAE